MNFVDASGYCHNVLGALVDIFGPDKEKDIECENLQMSQENSRMPQKQANEAYL